MLCSKPGQAHLSQTLQLEQKADARHREAINLSTKKTEKQSVNVIQSNEYNHCNKYLAITFHDARPKQMQFRFEYPRCYG